MSSKNEKKVMFFSLTKNILAPTNYYILTTSPLNFLRIGKEA